MAIEESLYAARALPLYLRQKVFPNLSCGDGYRIEPFQQKDSFNPKGWCGEYFAVKTNPVDKTNPIYGDDSKQIGVYWVGTYFDGKRDLEGNIISAGALVCEKIGCYIKQLSKSPKHDLVSILNAILKQDSLRSSALLLE